jgi:hypothetical protein
MSEANTKLLKLPERSGGINFSKDFFWLLFLVIKKVIK